MAERTEGMTKDKLARLIDLERDNGHGNSWDLLTSADLIELGRLRQEFETWTPIYPPNDPWRHMDGTLKTPTAPEREPTHVCPKCGRCSVVLPATSWSALYTCGAYLDPLAAAGTTGKQQG